MALRFALYDLDETLYPFGSGVMERMRDLMNTYIQEQLGLSAEEAETLRHQFYQQYGTTFAGLRQEHKHLDPDYFLHYVHDIPLSQYLSANEPLQQMLLALPLRRVVFTNGTLAHAQRVLDALGLSECFERVIDVEHCGYISKPNPAPYHTLLATLEARGEECVLIEDSVRNLEPAKALGMSTIWVHPEPGAIPAWVDYHTTDVLETGPLITALCRNPEQP